MIKTLIFSFSILISNELVGQLGPPLVHTTDTLEIIPESSRIVVFDSEVEGEGLSIFDGKYIANSVRVMLSKFSPHEYDVLEREEIEKLYRDRHNAEKTTFSL